MNPNLYQEENTKKYDKLALIFIFCIILFIGFGNVAHPRFINIIGTNFAGILSWYFLVGLGVYTLFLQYIKKIPIVDNSKYFMIRYLVLYIGAIILSLFVGIYTYPYFDTNYFVNTNSESFGFINNFSNKVGFVVNNQLGTTISFIFRNLKNSILTIIYTFGGSYIMYLYIKRDFDKYWKYINLAVIISSFIVIMVTIIEILYYYGNSYAKDLLVMITPYFHVIKISDGWWPPLLWDKQQIRSIFPEPSYIGNYMAFVIPFIWGKYLASNSKKYTIFYGFYSLSLAVIVFLSQARTANAVYFVLLALLLFWSIFIHRIFIKKVLSIIAVSIIALFISISLINGMTVDVNNSHVNNLHVEKYLDSNLNSLNKKDTRSNGARFGLIKASLQVSKDHILLGVGPGLSTLYMVDVFEMEDNDNGEINMWIDTVKSKGVLSKNINAMNDYLTRLMEQGVIGSIIFIIPFIIALYRLFCNRRNLNKSDQIKFSVTLLTLLGCLISNINESSTVVYCTWVSLAIAYAFTYKFSKLNM